jgi:hypothetical protein
MNRTEAIVLTDTFQNSRQLTKYYLSKLKEVDPLKNYEYSGLSFNSYYWIIGHLTWAENYLLHKSVLGKGLDTPQWLEQFSIGQAVNDETTEWPSFQEVLNQFKEVNLQTQALAPLLSLEDLNKLNFLGINFSGDDSRKSIFMHAIRHEGTHCGHLGWICKFNGIKTI